MVIFTNVELAPTQRKNKCIGGFIKCKIKYIPFNLNFFLKSYVTVILLQ